MIAGWLVITESRSPTAPRLDLVGMILAITGVLMLVYPLAEGRTLGWPAWTFALMTGSAVVLAIFVGYERWRTRTAGSPLMPLGLFRARTFSAGMAIWLIFWIALGGFFLAWMLYLQIGLGWTPLHAGLTAVTFAVGAAAGAGLSVQVLTPRFGRRVLVAGALLNAAGFAGYAWASAHYGPAISSWAMVGPLVITGFGFGLVVAPMVDLILTGVPVPDAGSGSGLLSTVQQVGMALGYALVGVVFFAVLASGSAQGTVAVLPSLHRQLAAAGVPPPDQSRILARFRACVQERSAATDPARVPAVCRVTLARGPATPVVRQTLARAGLQANAHNFARTFAIVLGYAAGLLVLVGLGMLALPRRMRHRDSGAEQIASQRPEVRA
jgi:hypothetical protein